MIRALASCIASAECVAIALYWAHVDRFTLDMFGPIMAGIAAASFLGCIGLGLLWTEVRVLIARSRAGERMSCYFPEDNPQPTL